MPAFSKCSLSFYQNFIDYDIGIILFENMCLAATEMILKLFWIVAGWLNKKMSLLFFELGILDFYLQAIFARWQPD